MFSRHAACRQTPITLNLAASGHQVLSSVQHSKCGTHSLAGCRTFSDVRNECEGPLTIDVPICRIRSVLCGPDLKQLQDLLELQ